MNRDLILGSFGSGLSLVGMALVGCDSTAVLVLICTTVAASYTALGGSYFNNLDLSPNFTGPLMGINYTCLNVLGVITPVVIGIMTKGNVSKINTNSYLIRTLLFVTINASPALKKR